MLASRVARHVFFPLMLLALSGLAWPAFIVLREGLDAGVGEAWMVLWLLAFVFVLPATLLLLPSLAAVIDAIRLAHHRDNVPLAGGKVP